MRILFFSHACGRTGSELALHRLICHADRTRLEMVVACGARGPLAAEFPADVHTLRYSHALTFADRALREGSWALRLVDATFDASIRWIHRRVRPDAWYVNTLVQPKVVRLARALGVPCVLHTHEFAQMLSLLRPEEVRDLLDYPRLVIAASECAADVVRSLGRHNDVEVCHEPIVVDAIASDPQRTGAVRRALGIPSDAFVWAMSGTRDPRKNPVAFARAANELVARAPGARLLWIGGEDTGYSLYARGLVRTPELDGHVLWVDERGADYFDYLNAADAVVMTSWDESLSMVILEAASLGKPFVSFASGGPQEIFRPGMGAIVDSWNVDDLVTAMLKLMRGEIPVSPDVCRGRARDFDVTTVVKRWQDLLTSRLAAG